MQVTMKSLTVIQADVDRLAAMIGAADHYSLPTYGQTEDGARPHIEVDSRGFHFVVIERGQEQSRFTTRDLDELFYRIFRDVTFSMAFDYELSHRVETQDCRRLGFERQVELLSQLCQRWSDRETEEHERILRAHPFDDYSGIRVSMTRELIRAGHPPVTAWKMACERYPLPVPQ
jgi:hypothetical protein